CNAWHGQTHFQLTGHCQSLKAESPLQMRLKIRKLRLTRALAARLPLGFQQQWRNFSPEGEIDLDARLIFDGQNWDNELAVATENAALTYVKFPYPLQRMAGTLSFRDDTLAIDFTSPSEDTRIRSL